MLASTSIIGRAHRLRQQNCHDFAITYSIQNGTQIGLVLDGCGSKYKNSNGSYPSQNEVGAKLLGEFVIRYLDSQLSQAKNLSKTIDNLYDASLSFLSNLINLYQFDKEQKKQFVYTNLLCTMVGFVMREGTAVFFWRGDGWLIHNDTIIDLNSNNHPDYLTYDLLNEPKGLHTKTISSTRIERIGVATDGWNKPLLTKLAPQKNEIMLQRWVNMQAKQTPNFEDDASIAICWNTKSKGDAEMGSRGAKSLSPLISSSPQPLIPKIS